MLSVMLHSLKTRAGPTQYLPRVLTYCVVRNSKAWCHDGARRDLDEQQELLAELPRKQQEEFNRKTYSVATEKDIKFNVDIPRAREQVDYSEEELARLLDTMDGDMPLADMQNPYQPPQRKCVICKSNIEVSYKNARLLSQFTSPYTGRIYGRHITGMCIPMQKHIAKCIKRSRMLGLMPHVYKLPEYLDDPKLHPQYVKQFD